MLRSRPSGRFSRSRGRSSRPRRRSSRPRGRSAHSAWLVVIPWLAVAGPEAADAQAPDPPVRWTVEPSPLLVAGDGGEYFQSIVQPVLLDDGRVVVADAGLRNVRLFDRTGDLVWRMGREGEGPGEFGSIHGLWRRADGSFGVWDGELDRMTRVSPDGELVDVTPVDPAGRTVIGGNLEVFFGALPDGSVLLASLSFGDAGTPSPEPVPDLWRIGVFGPDGRLEGEPIMLRGMRRANRFPVPFTPMPYVAARGDSVLTVDDAGSEISVRDRAGRVRRVVRVEVGPAGDGDPTAALRAELERQEKDLYLRALREMEAVDRDGLPSVAGLLVDPEGLLWVKRFADPHDSVWLRTRALRPAPGGEWRVFRRDGTALASVTMPAGFTPLQVAGDRLVGVSVDALGVERLTVHRLSRGR